MDSVQGQATGKRGEGTKELGILVGILLAVVVGTAVTIWVRTGPPDTGGEASAAATVSAGGEKVVASPPVAGTAGPSAAGSVAQTLLRSRVMAPAPGAGPVHHADVYFDFRSTRLRADAVRVLQDTVALMDTRDPWALLVQGHADHHGPAEYNRVLAERRADVVKRFLVELGVPDSSIRVVTIGQAGALCDDPTPECQQLNRRVHIEARRLPGVPASAIRAPIARGLLDIDDAAGTGGAAGPAMGAREERVDPAADDAPSTR
jgi:outer membrane protein OmpA-like peptidoglycan-associated protein